MQRADAKAVSNALCDFCKTASHLLSLVDTMEDLSLGLASWTWLFTAGLINDQYIHLGLEHSDEKLGLVHILLTLALRVAL